MHDFTLRDLHGHSVSYNSVIGDSGTVIVSHAVDPLAELDYFRYLTSLGARVVMVISKPNNLLHMMNEAHDLGMDTYTDPDMNMITLLKQRWHLAPDLGPLSRLLRFQILYRDGRELRHWQQPCSDQWKHFLADRDVVKRFIDLFGSWGVKWLQSQDKDSDLVWSSTNQAAFSEARLTIKPELEMFLKYYHLMPNQELIRDLGEIRGDHKPNPPITGGQ